MATVRRSSARIQALTTATGAGSPPQEAQAQVAKEPKATKSRKRKADASPAEAPQKSAKRTSPATSAVDDAASAQPPPPPPPAVVGPDEEDSFVPAILSFDFQEAKKHLTTVDSRFEDLFSKMKCRPFESLEQLHPFRALAISILGQQISWLAARSITHRFIRLYDPSLPEKPTDEERKAITFFPSPSQVAATEIPTLRTAGLSARKAEYIKDLATRFADGRLSTQKLMEADDEELARMLIEVRGIGRWTVDMFAIFSMRRPDILPVGDLGVQKGLVRWFLSLHSPAHKYSISPEKIGGAAASKAKDRKAKNTDEVDVLPALGEEESGEPNQATGSSVLPADGDGGVEELPTFPPTFTPSIKKTLHKVATEDVEALPPGIDVGLLKARLQGKKIKGAFLTPQEMEALTESWKPYRSIGIYYMWSLADAVAE